MNPELGGRMFPFISSCLPFFNSGVIFCYLPTYGNSSRIGRIREGDDQLIRKLASTISTAIILGSLGYKSLRAGDLSHCCSIHLSYTICLFNEDGRQYLFNFPAISLFLDIIYPVSVCNGLVNLSMPWCSFVQF